METEHPSNENQDSNSNASDVLSPRNVLNIEFDESHNDQKRKNKRRRKRSSRKLSGPKIEESTIGPPSDSGREELQKHSLLPKKKKKDGTRVTGPVLRPVGSQVPRAPNNSTQFIMDDHENSSLFVHFNTEEIETKPETREPDGSSPFPPGDWFPYNIADFEFAYRKAREDQMMNANIGDLRKAILGLEARIAVVSEYLEASPSRILSRLQEQLLRLQEDNRSLKSRKLTLESAIESSSSSSSSSSTTSTSSSSTSSSSDSECSDPECGTCHVRRNEEEKENTRPLPSDNTLSSRSSGTSSSNSSQSGEIVLNPSQTESDV